MKVGFDISQTAHIGGVATYTKNLAVGLYETDLEMVYFYSSLRQVCPLELKGIKRFRLPPSVLERIFNEFRLIPIEQFIGSIDVFHSSDWLQPKTKAKKVTTYHDVIPLKYPEWSVEKIIRVHKKRLELVEREIDCVIAVSETTKQDLIENSHIPETKIKVVYEGVSSNFRQFEDSEIEAFRLKYNLPQNFLLGIGGKGNRRNLARASEAARGYNLVVTGTDIPWLSDAEMPLLYASAQALIYPSLYEGFGLPILEAQACGIPVLTSSVGAMREIAEGSALLVDPDEIDQIERGIREIVDDSETRKHLIAAGVKNTKKYSWQKCVEETAKIYANL